MEVEILDQETCAIRRGGGGCGGRLWRYGGHQCAGAENGWQEDAKTSESKTAGMGEVHAGERSRDAGVDSGRESCGEGCLPEAGVRAPANRRFLHCERTRGCAFFGRNDTVGVSRGSRELWRGTVCLSGSTCASKPEVSPRRTHDEAVRSSVEMTRVSEGMATVAFEERDLSAAAPLRDAFGRDDAVGGVRRTVRESACRRRRRDRCRRRRGGSWRCVRRPCRRRSRGRCPVRRGWDRGRGACVRR